MAIVFMCLGVVLALAGLVGGVYSIDMLPTERGIAGSIASAIFVVGGCLVAAVGASVQRLEVLLRLLSAAAPELAAPQGGALPPDRSAEPPRPAAEMAGAVAMAPSPAPVSPVSVPDVPVMEVPTVPIRLPEPPVPKATPAPGAPRQLSTGEMLGAGAAVAAAAAAASAAIKVPFEARAKPVAETVPPAPVRHEPLLPEIGTHIEPELPVEILAPYVEPEPPVVAPPMPVTVTMPDPIAVAAPVADPAPAPVAAEAKIHDPLDDFVSELDRLIPLVPAKPASAAPEPPKVVAPAEPAPPPPVAEPRPTLEGVLDPEAALDEIDQLPEPVIPAPGAEIVGAYESGGAKYTMYSDGSVIAEAGGETMRFRSLDELRVFLDEGATRG